MKETSIPLDRPKPHFRYTGLVAKGKSIKIFQLQRNEAGQTYGFCILGNI